MQIQDTKISNLFKEKKRTNRKMLTKDSVKDLLNEDDKKFLILLNKKRNKPEGIPLSNETEKNKKLKKDEDNSTLKSNKFNNNSKILISPTPTKTGEDIVMLNNNDNNNFINNNENELFNNNKEFEISSKTKKILNKILSNKKKENEKKKILNQYNIEQNIISNKINKNNNSNCNNSNNGDICVNSLNNLNKKIEPPKLSLKTIEIMKKLKEDRKNRFERKENNDKEFHNKSSFSTLHLKYDELISKKRELRLPIKYKELFNSFINLEHLINLNKVRSPYKINTFENIKKGIEAMTHHTFNMKTFQQIMYIVPHFYIVKYVKKNDNNTFKLNDEINKNYDLAIEIPKNYKERMYKNYEQNFNFLNINYYKENDKNFNPNYTSLNILDMKKREEIFRNILNLIVNIYHQKFLNEKKINIKFNPLEQKTWHHKFDPDKECSDIPLFEIPLPPMATSVFQSTIMKNDIKNEIMKDALSMINIINTNNNNITHSNEKNNKAYNDSKSENKKNNNKYVSQSFLNKLRAKEKANSIINEIQNYSMYHNNLKDMNNIYREVLMQMKTLLMVNKNNHKLNEISELLLNSNKSIKECFVDVEKMGNIIIKLCKKFKGFISVKNHSLLGPVVVLENKDFVIPTTISLDI